MATLFSYIVAHDNGAAPNPFWGVCTLVLCKPRIRRVAHVDDWVVGLGSAGSPLGDIRRHVVYAMRITAKLSMKEYDAYVREHLPGKIPDRKTRDPRRHVGDAIYAFDADPPRMRPGVHRQDQRARDLSGGYALLSKHFYYFGDQPQPLPAYLHGVVPSARGHRSEKNASYVEPFLHWLTGLGLTPNQLYGRPAGPLFRDWTPEAHGTAMC